MKTVVIYWSGTGNTKAMAEAVAEGAGAELFEVSAFSGNIEDYDRIALVQYCFRKQIRKCRINLTTVFQCYPNWFKRVYKCYKI